MEKTFTCNLCDALCGLRVEVTGEPGTAQSIGSIRGNAADVFSRGHLCPKAIGLAELWRDPDRIRSPLRRVGDRFEVATWEEALTDVAQRLGAIRGEHGRDAVGIYVGNPVVHSHRAGLASQVLTAALGTHNRFDPNSQDGNPRLFACAHVYGDALTMPVADVDRLRHLLVLGANPAASNGSQLGLGDVRARMRSIRERGGRVVLVDPRRTESAAWADQHVFIRPGGDAALLLAMLNVLFASGRIDLGALAARASGAKELRTIATRFPPERVASAIGIDAATITTLATDLLQWPETAVYARVGVSVNEFGPLASWLVEAINIVIGSFDREGGVMLPTPAADIGPIARAVVRSYEPRWRSRVRGLPEFMGAIPSTTMREEIETPGPGQIRALVVLAGNPVLSVPDGERLQRALGSLELLVSIDYYVNETSRLAHWILPPRHVFETGNYDLVLARFAVREMAKWSAPIASSGDDTRDDWQIAIELATRLGQPGSSRIRRAIVRALENVPERLVDTLLRVGPRRLSLRALEKAPNGLDFGPMQRRGRVPTPDGRPRLAPPVFVSDLPRLQQWIESPRPALVLIGRRHLRSNNSWMHNLPTLVKGPSRTGLFMHPEDAAARGIEDRSMVEISSRTGAGRVEVSLTSDVMKGVVSLPHGYGHQAARSTLRVAGQLDGMNINALTDEQRIEPLIGTSILNGLEVEVRPG